MPPIKRIVVYGAGGYGQELAWLIDDLNAVSPVWDLAGYVDDDQAKRHQSLYGRPVLGDLTAAAEILGTGADIHYVLGIGAPKRRREIVDHLQRGSAWQPVALVHPKAVLADHVQVEPGATVGAGCIIGPYARLGAHTALIVAASLGHDSHLGPFSVMSPGARVSGECRVGEAVLIGSNAVVAQGVTVGQDATVGALSFVIRSVPAGYTAYGNPARSYLASREK